MKLNRKSLVALIFVLGMAPNTLFSAVATPVPSTPPGQVRYWDRVVLPRVIMDHMFVEAALNYVDSRCNGEYKPPGAKPVIFEYHYAPKKALQPVTLDLNDVTVPDLLREICEPYNIAIEEKPDRIIFTDRKNY